jgi:hypothetical protein
MGHRPPSMVVDGPSTTFGRALRNEMARDPVTNGVS